MSPAEAQEAINAAMRSIVEATRAMDRERAEVIDSARRFDALPTAAQHALSDAMASVADTETTVSTLEEQIADACNVVRIALVAELHDREDARRKGKEAAE